MWKVCQLLKGRSQLSRPCNANNLVSPGQSSSPGPCNNESHVEPIHRHSRLPAAFTPSEFRAYVERYVPPSLIPRLVSLHDHLDRLTSTYKNDHDEKCENSERERGEGGSWHRRPGRDQDYWRCRCRCRFGDWVGYTTMVAASIHLSRVTVHLLPDNNDKLDARLVENDNENELRLWTASLKHSIHSGWYRLFYRAAPVLFPDLFKYFYVLPQTAPSLAAANLEGSADTKAIEEQKNAINEFAAFDLSSSESSTESSSGRGGSDDCAVQTDSVSYTPYNELVQQSGRRLAVLSRLNDVGLAHALGVDFLKRQLYDEAIDHLLGAAQSGHAGALYNLGVCYSQGYGVRRDLYKAVECWRAAGDQGHGLSKYQMGVCHVRGLGGLAIDHERALRYMESAAAAGVPEAITYMAANEYKKSRLESALEFLCEAVAAGDAQARELLKEWSLNGIKNNSHEKTTDSHSHVTFNAPSEPSHKTVKPRLRRNRFWASSSSDKEDSLSSSPSSLIRDTRKTDDSGSVVFYDDLNSTTREQEALEMNASSVIETVASILKLRSLRRSKTAPELRETAVAVPAVEFGGMDVK